MTIREPLPPPPYRPYEVAAMFRVDAATVGRWRVKGKLKAIRTPGGQYRYPRDSTDELLAKGAGANPSYANVIAHLRGGTS